MMCIVCGLAMYRGRPEILRFSLCMQPAAHQEELFREQYPALAVSKRWSRLIPYLYQYNTGKQGKERLQNLEELTFLHSQ